MDALPYEGEQKTHISKSTPELRKLQPCLSHESTPLASKELGAKINLSFFFKTKSFISFILINSFPFSDLKTQKQNNIIISHIYFFFIFSFPFIISTQKNHFRYTEVNSLSFSLSLLHLLQPLSTMSEQLQL